MVASLLRSTVAVAFLFSSGSVEAARTAPSAYCIAIAGDAEDKNVLATLFDDFAQETGLFIDSSHPLARVYTPEDVASPTQGSALIVLEKMGPFGSILSYTPLRNSHPAGLLDQLKQFVADSIAPAYPTTRCDEIKGFTPPATYYRERPQTRSLQESQWPAPTA